MEESAGNCIHPEDNIIAGFVFYFVNKSKYSETCASSTVGNMISYMENYQAALFYVNCFVKIQIYIYKKFEGYFLY